MSLLALGGAQRAGVIAVGDVGYDYVAGEGSATCVHGVSVGSRGVERVDDADVGARGVLTVAHEAAAVGGAVGGDDFAVEHAAADVEHCAAGHTPCEATVGAVARDATADGDAATAVGDVERRVADAANDAACKLVAGRDGAADGAVLDSELAPCLADDAAGFLAGSDDVGHHVKAADDGGGAAHIADVAERGHAVGGGGFEDGAVHEGQRIAVAVECAAEVMAAAARHAGDGVLSRADIRA